MDIIRSNKKYIVVMLVVVAIITSVTILVSYLSSTKEVVVYYKNSKDVNIHIFSGEHIRGSNKIAEIKKSGDSIRLDKSETYQVTYSGSVGYEDGLISFKPSDKGTIKINPHYSQDKLSQLLSSQKDSIHNVIKSKYSDNIHLYEIQPGKLYHFGDWYGTTLKYTGDDYSNSDTLRIVLRKEGDSWVIKTDPPSISLNKYVFPKIPVDVLVNVNNFQKNKMLEKFTNPDTSHGVGGQ